MLKLGIDVHGVIDHNPAFFSRITHMLSNLVEIHIISGGTIDNIKEILSNNNIHYDYIFSIPDYHTFKGTDVLYDKEGRVWMDDYIWNSSKGIYCEENDINIMVDDSEMYRKYMPKNTYFHLYTGNCSECQDSIIFG